MSEGRTRGGSGGVLALAGWCGLAAGLLEVAARVLRTRLGIGGSRLYDLSRHFVWLVPVTEVLVFLAVGAALALLGRAAPRAGRRLAVRALAALAPLPALMVALPQIHAGALFVLACGVAARAVPAFERRPEAARRLLRRSGVGMLAAVLLLAAWVVGGAWIRRAREVSRPRPPRGSPNVLIIVLDTVRRDRLSLHGYPRPTTPALEQLARQRRGIRFDAARSSSPWTLPSHGGLFTGRPPHELRARWLAPLGARFPTLAGYLGSNGYATAGFVANTLYCGRDTGLADGFTHYSDHDLPQLDAFLMAKLTERALIGFFAASSWLRERGSPGPLAPIERFIQEYVYSGKRRDAAGINEAFLGWLAGRGDDRPFFAFLNYMDAHAAYFPPRPNDYRFGLRPASPADYQVLQDWEDLDKPALPPRFRALASDSYDNCIRALDDQLRFLFADLMRQGVLDRTLVIVTSDHGEAFGEHGLFSHGDSLYRPELDVPLLVLPPGPQPARAPAGETVSLLDIPATVVDLLGLEQGSPFPGRSLARTWDGSSGEGEAARYAVSELAEPNPTRPNQGRSPARAGPLTALTDGRYGYIAGGPGGEELYDWQSDPREERNLAADPRLGEVAARFRRAIAGGRTTAESGRPPGAASPSPDRLVTAEDPQAGPPVDGPEALR